jgi:hypothetical protein
MAEKDKKHSSSHGPKIPFGLEVILFVVAIFIIWILTGGAKEGIEDRSSTTTPDKTVKPYIKYEPTDTINSNYPN